VVEYERHEPEKTLLHPVVREELESFLSRARERGSPVAGFVEREIRAYLDCVNRRLIREGPVRGAERP
jgi:hypothetical protein